MDRIALITTADVALWGFFQPLLIRLRRHGWDVHAICSPGRRVVAIRENTASVIHEISMFRGISPVADVVALTKLIRLLGSLKPGIVHTHTPKAGLLGMIGAAITRVPARVYTINGLVVQSERGLRRAVLLRSERLACRLATQVITVSHSLRRTIIDLSLCPPEKIMVPGQGSSHGVDTAKFSPAVRTPEVRNGVRRRYRIPADALVIAFVGRFVPDKGIRELAQAWRIFREKRPSAHLLLCGDFEPEHPVDGSICDVLKRDPRVHLTGGFIDDMPSIYAAVDICVLPTYREGLPNVALEAGAMGVPTVASRVDGCVDAIVDGDTGLLVPPRDSRALAEAIDLLGSDDALRNRLGESARRFVAANFSEETVLGAYEEIYRKAFGAGTPVPS